MKVEVGHCTSCGEKNSKFVQNCYKCQAPLPWAADYQAPKPAPAPKAEAVAPAQSAPSQNGAPTIVVLPNDAPSADNQTPANPQNVSLTDNAAPSSPGAWPYPNANAATDEAAKPKKSMPPYVGWGVAGLLGIACIALWARGNSAPSLPPANVIVGTPAPVGVASQTPAAAPTTQPTNASATATGAPTTAAPMQIPSQAEPTSTALPPALNPPAATAPASATRKGPSFAEYDERMTDAGKKYTDAQKQNYLDSVLGSKVTWTGRVVNATAGGSSQIVLNCGSRPSDTVTVALDGTQSGRLTSIGKGQSVTIEGILGAPSGSNYTLSQGHIVS